MAMNREVLVVTGAGGIGQAIARLMDGGVIAALRCGRWQPSRFAGATDALSG